MKRAALFMIGILLAAVLRLSAEEKEYPKPADDEVPHSALEALKG